MRDVASSGLSLSNEKRSYLLERNAANKAHAVAVRVLHNQNARALDTASAGLCYKNAPHRPPLNRQCFAENKFSEAAGYGTCRETLSVDLHQGKSVEVRPYRVRVTDYEQNAIKVVWTSEKMPHSPYSNHVRPLSAKVPHRPKAANPWTQDSGGQFERRPRVKLDASSVKHMSASRHPTSHPLYESSLPTATPRSSSPDLLSGSLAPVYLHVPPHCWTCGLKEMRAIHPVSSFLFLSRHRQRIATDPSIVRNKIRVIVRTNRREQRQSSATMVQASWKAWHARQQFFLLRVSYAAAVVIQSSFRAWLDRTYSVWFRRLNTKASIRMQRQWRRYLFRKKLRERRGALKIQAVWRAFRSRRYVRRVYRRYVTAVYVIQMRYRLFQCRKNYFNLIHKMKIASIKLQAVWRGYRCHKPFRWYMADLHSAASRVQRIVKGWLTRRHVQAMRIEVNGAAKDIQMCWRRHRVHRRSVERLNRKTMSAIKIQRRWRRYYMRFYFQRWKRFNTAPMVKIQALARMWLRRQQFRKDLAVWRRNQAAMDFLNKNASIIQATIKARKARYRFLQIRQACIFLQRALRPFISSLIVARRRAQVQKKIHSLYQNYMKELRRLLVVDSLFAPAPLLLMDRSAVFNLFASYKRRIRMLFLKYSVQNLQSSEKAPRLSRLQFARLLKEATISEDLPQSTVTELFVICNRNPGTCSTASSISIPPSPRKSTTSTIADDGADSMTLDEFTEACLRLAILKYDRSCRDLARPSNVSTSMKLRWFLEKYIQPSADQVLSSSPIESDILDTDTEAKAVLSKYMAKLRKLFRRYSARSFEGTEAEGKSINVGDFCVMMRELRMIDSNLSVSRAAEAFVFCNRPVLLKFLGDDPEHIDLWERMQMGFDEFCHALGRCAIGPDSVRTGNLSVSKLLDRFLGKLTSVL